MRHWYVDDSLSGEHYAVAHNGLGRVLLQTQDSSGHPAGQGRARLTVDQARHCAKLLEKAALEAESFSLEAQRRAAASRAPRDEEVDWANCGAAAKGGERE